MIGRTLGRYRVLGALGEGGMGRVFLAEDPSLGRRVAIKVLPPEVAGDEALRGRLRLEAQAASALNHPNILTIHDLGEDGGTLYVAMELVDGTTLRAWAAGRAHAPAATLAVLRQATRALAVAHAAGLVHRDLKPENLMIRADGLLKILDFGLARSVSPVHEGATVAGTMPGAILGTAPYMSPEQVLGRPAGPASDVFSLGTMLYELLTGTHPFAGPSAVETMHAVLHDVPPAPSTIAGEVPPELDFIVLKTLSKDPARRYATARELDLDLETCEVRLGAAKPGPAAAATAGPRAIAVLPFKNIGGNPDLDYLGLGLADAVINRLSTSPDLVVRATSTIGRYAGQVVEATQVAKDLAVTAVLDASFQRAGERFRATARLVDSEGRSLWAGKVDLDFVDVFEVQDRVASGISAALTARLAARAGAGSHVPDPRAFDLYMRAGREHFAGTPASFRQGIAYAEEAVRIDPGYADAWVMLARITHGMFDSGYDSDPIWLSRSTAANARARALDPGHPEALFMEGASNLIAGRTLEAWAALSEAHRRLPNDSLVFHYLAYLYRLCGMVDAFVAAEVRAIELEPGSPWPYWSLSRVALERGDLAEGRAWEERARQRFPDLQATWNRTWNLWIYEGRAGEALSAIDRIADRPGRDPHLHLTRAFACAFLGRAAEARAELLAIDSAVRLDMDFAAYAAAIEGMLGDPDAAFGWLERAHELGNAAVYQYENPQLFGALHGDPRWAGFLARVRERSAEVRREVRWPVPAA